MTKRLKKVIFFNVVNCTVGRCNLALNNNTADELAFYSWSSTNLYAQRRLCILIFQTFY